MKPLFYSEAGNRKPDNTLVKGNYKTLQGKLKIEQHEPGGYLTCTGSENISCYTSGTCRITVIFEIMYAEAFRTDVLFLSAN